MSKKKVGIIIGIAVVVIAAAGIGGFFLKDKLTTGGGASDDKVYVESISDMMNQYSGVSNRFNGTVESQETYEVKVDSSRTIKEVNVSVGDEVKVGDVLLSYDTDDLNSQVKQAKLDIEGMQDEIDNYNRQINTLTTERAQAADADKFEYTTQIQTLQNSIQQTKYNMESKQLEIDKLEKQIDDSTVTSKVDGVVKSINENQTDEYGNAAAYMTVMQTGDYRIKGSIDEQNIWSISEGQSVIIRSRVDDSITWTGTISQIDTENQIQNNNNYYYSDSGEKASKYPFYIQLDSVDNLILGQHVYIELDEGQEEVKEGIWLYSYYIVMDDGDPYVWADNGKGKLEKRTVELGDYDEMLDEYEVVSGLTEDDLITWPMPGLYEGVTTVTNAEEVDYNSPLYTESVEDEMMEDGMMEDYMGEDEYLYDTEMMMEEEFYLEEDAEAAIPEEDVAEDTEVTSY
ncbi:MAG: efflux RND transporter periplasmic adaptor subunit [Roseburia sp.]